MEKKDRINKAFSYLKDNGLVHTQRDMAEKMGATAPNVSSALKGTNSVLTDNFLLRFNNAFGGIFNEKWLLKGEGEMLNDTKSSESPVGIPLIPQDAMAGALGGSDSQWMDYNCERYVIPEFSDCDFLMRIHGDSMIPDYYPGDLVACKIVVMSKLWFQWGKVYIVDTCQGALLKRIFPSDREACIKLVSSNQAYPAFDLEASEIHGVALVKGLIRN